MHRGGGVAVRGANSDASWPRERGVGSFLRRAKYTSGGPDGTKGAEVKAALPQGSYAV
jgi:hypothetical protein